MLTGEQLDLEKYVTDEGGIWSLRDVEKVRGWNNIEYGAGLSGKNTPSTGLSMNRAYIPPGGIAKAHIHVDFDVMIFLLKGSVRHEYGPGCKKSVLEEVQAIAIKPLAFGMMFIEIDVVLGEGEGIVDGFEDKIRSIDSMISQIEALEMGRL